MKHKKWFVKKFMTPFNEIKLKIKNTKNKIGSKDE